MECSYEAPAGQPHYEPPLPDGFVEERLQVDRKRLEAMITGNPTGFDAITTGHLGKRDPVLGFNLPEATEFFDRVRMHFCNECPRLQSSGAIPIWCKRVLAFQAQDRGQNQER